MSAPIRLVTLNAENKAAASWDQIQSRLSKGQNPGELPFDVIAIAEASERRDGLVSKLIGLGLAAAGVAYEDIDGRKDTHWFVMAGKYELITRLERVDMGNRQVMKAVLTTGIDVIGVHFDDRRESTRRTQVQTVLAEHINPERLTVIGGDMNALPARDWRAKGLRALTPFAEMLPQGEPGMPQSKLARIGSLAARLVHMAEGGPLDLLEAAGYRDVDPKRHATRGFAPIDHIYIPEELDAAAFAVCSMRGISDHDALAVTVFERTT